MKSDPPSDDYLDHSYAEKLVRDPYIRRKCLIDGKKLFVVIIRTACNPGTISLNSLVVNKDLIYRKCPKCKNFFSDRQCRFINDIEDRRCNRKLASMRKSAKREKIKIFANLDAEKVWEEIDNRDSTR